MTSKQKREQDAREEAARIKAIADKQCSGGQMGGTFFGQEHDGGMNAGRG